MKMRIFGVAAAGVLGAGLLAGGPAQAAPCGGDFNAFLSRFSAEAQGRGISSRVIASAFAGLSRNATVIRLDRSQKSFKLSYAQFAAKRITRGRLDKARKLLRRHGQLLARIERGFGVPAPVLVAIWGLETDFGVNMGKMAALRSIATLAHDCRRSAFFQNELMSALQIVQRGDMRPAAMRGAWAGELGQTQFLASSYMRFAVDFDGDGRRDLIRSVPDVLASTANYLKAYGWRRGGGWQPGSENFQALRGWNKSAIYSRTIGEFAARLARR